MANKKIVYYTSKNSECEPCKEINDLVEQGSFRTPDGDLDVVDITTEEGWERFNKEVLSKQDGAVPSAYLEGKKCMIMIAEDGMVDFECPSSDVPSTPEPISSQPENAV